MSKQPALRAVPCPTPYFTDRGYWAGTIKMALNRFFVLRTLSNGPAHGYEIARDVERITNGCCSPSEGVLGLHMASGLANADAARLVAYQGKAPYVSVEEIWRRTRLPMAALERLAEADAFQGLGGWRSGRCAAWPTNLCRCSPRRTGAARPEPEASEPPVTLPPTLEGCEVVEGYRSTGLSLRQRPVAFQQDELRARDGDLRLAT